MKRVRPLCSFLLLTAVACGPQVVVPAEGTETGATPAESSTTADPTPDDETAPPGTSALDSTGEPPATSDDTTDDGRTFLGYPEVGSSDYECDLFTQNCPPGSKCMPWANDGGSSWNATRCSPIAEDPGEPGDPCTVEGNGASGIDDCELAAMCWDVDPRTNEGTCVAMCTGSWEDPICEDPNTHCALSGDGAILPCLPDCDPLTPDCLEGQGCYPVDIWWQCIPDGSGDVGGQGDPCEYINGCDPGFVCTNATGVPDCDGPVGCCTALCDLDLPVCTGGVGLECLPWYDEDYDLPHYEDVGVCLLP